MGHSVGFKRRKQWKKTGFSMEIEIIITSIVDCVVRTVKAGGIKRCYHRVVCYKSVVKET
jgi:hypothetical protein